MPLPETLIEGKYEILAKLREGGMGTIYKVHHRLLDEVRVIKVIRGELVADEELKRRFLEEAKVATRLKHPNIGTIHDFALGDDGTAYLVMEFIDGVNLADLVHAQGPVGVPLTIEIGHQALLALGYLHRKNVVHRDIAPDNLMLTRGEDGQPLIKLIDLGVAKALDKGGDLTSTGVFLGKLKYASPEQYGALPPGEKIDGRSDLYSLGVVLYLLLTGRRPFLGDRPAELLRAHLTQPPIPFSETDPEGKIPTELRALVLRALEKKREDRFATADEFDRELLVLRSHFAPPEELEHTIAILSSVRPSDLPSHATVTPSAQGRLDRHFAAGSTPRPTWSERSEAATLASAPAAGVERRPPISGVTPPPAAARRGLSVWLLAVVALAAAGAVTLFWIRARPAPTVATSDRRLEPRAAAVPASLPAAEATTVAPTAAPVAADAAEARPTAPDLRPTAAPEAPQRRAKPIEVPLVRPAAPGREAVAPKPKDSVLPVRQAEFPSPAAAREPSPRAEATAPQAEAPKPAAVPTSLAAEAPRSAPPSPAEIARAAPSDQDRIRETLRTYEKALNTLDVGLYARVYPALESNRRQVEANWEALRSQQVELEIRQIDIRNSHAVVRVFQRLVAVPRVGSELRDARERTLELEKRGNVWVITALR